MSENDFYLLPPLFGPQIEDLSMKIYQNFCEDFFYHPLVIEYLAKVYMDIFFEKNEQFSK